MEERLSFELNDKKVWRLIGELENSKKNMDDYDESIHSLISRLRNVKGFDSWNYDLSEITRYENLQSDIFTLIDKKKSMLTDTVTSLQNFQGSEVKTGNNVFATGLVAILSLVEGFASGVEGMIDGLATGTTLLLGWIPGYNDMIGDFVEKDYSKNAFDALYENTTVGQWAVENSAMDPDGIAANIIKGVGTVAAYVVATAIMPGNMGMWGYLAAEAAVAFVGTTGISMEDGLNNGKTFKEARADAFTDAAIAAVTTQVGQVAKTAEIYSRDITKGTSPQEAGSEPVTEIVTEPVPDPGPGPGPVPKPEPDPDPKPEPEKPTQPQQNTESKTTPETTPETLPETTPQTSPQPTQKTEPETTPQTSPKTEIQTSVPQTQSPTTPHTEPNWNEKCPICGTYPCTCIPKTNDLVNIVTNTTTHSIENDFDNNLDDITDLTTGVNIPTSASSLATSVKISDNKMIPIMAGLGATALAALGTKTIIDKKQQKDEENSLEAEEWSEEDEIENKNFDIELEESDYLTPTDDYAFQPEENIDYENEYENEDKYESVNSANLEEFN